MDLWNKVFNGPFSFQKLLSFPKQKSLAASRELVFRSANTFVLQIQNKIGNDVACLQQTDFGENSSSRLDRHIQESSEFMSCDKWTLFILVRWKASLQSQTSETSIPCGNLPGQSFFFFCGESNLFYIWLSLLSLFQSEGSISMVKVIILKYWP